MRKRNPYLFDEFLSSGLEESISPFLTPSSRNYSKNLPLRTSIISAVLLTLSFIMSFHSALISNMFLVSVYVFAGTKALIETIEDLKNFEINIDVLMILAAFLSILIKSPMEGALLLVLFSLSGAMEETVSQKSRRALHDLTHLSPCFIPVLQQDGSTLERSVKEIEIDTKILVQAGEVIPLDGLIISGESFVNMVHLTGESSPIPKKPGHEVQAGSRSLDGTLTILVKKTSAESTLSKIAKLIQEAQESKPKIERFFDRFSKKYATTIILLACGFSVALPFLLHIPFTGIEGSIYRALAFLIAASPCALIIAIPTAYLSAMSACSKKGILLKGGITLDAIASCKAVGFDKTGTLTTGELEILTFERFYGSLDKSLALSLAGSLELHAKHPIAKAIVAFAKNKNVPFHEIKDFQSIPGQGLIAKVALHGITYDVKIGLSEFILSHQSDPARLDILQKAIGDQLHSLCLLAVNDSLFLFEFKDKLRNHIQSDLLQLKKNHALKFYMLTGDHETSAKEVAKETHMDGVYYNLRPNEKMEKISELSEHLSLAMIGDGINDAPALSRATVGISMGQFGSSTAIDASDIILLNDDTSSLNWLFSKAKKTKKIIRENLCLALFVILFATTPSLLGYIPLWLAVILHEGGTVIVGLNSLRLLKK